MLRTTTHTHVAPRASRSILPQRCRMLIESLGVYYPAGIVTTADILAGCKGKWWVPLERVTGIQRRRMVEEGEYSHDLAVKAVLDCLSRSRYAADEIDALISCDISKCSGPKSQSSIEPSAAVRLAAELGFTGAMAFDVRNACAGFFTALVVAQSLLHTGAARRVMVVSGEHITHLIRTAQLEIESPRDARMACLTLGDAGVAALLELGPENGTGFHDIQLYTLGRYSSLCVGKVSDRPHGGAIMLTDSAKIAEVGVDQFARHAPRFLRDCGIRPEDCDQFIMHQTAARSLRQAALALNRSFGRKVLNKANTVYNLAERGNTATTTHFVAMMDHIRNGTIRSGSNLFFGIAASGQTAGTALYTFDELPDRIRRDSKPRVSARSSPTPRHRCPGDDVPRVRVESLGVLPLGQPGQRNSLVQLTCAAQQCFGKSFYGPEDIELLINAGVYRNEFLSEPALAAVLAGELHMNDASESPDDRKTLAFDLSSGATGFLRACFVATQTIRSGQYGTAMIVASEIEYNGDILPDEVLGLEETASAVILDDRGDGETGFGRFFFHDETDHLHGFTAHSQHRDGRSTLWFARDKELESCFLRSICHAVREFLEQAEQRLADFDVIIPPQISPGFVERLGQLLAVPSEKLLRLGRHHRDLYTSSLAHSFQAMSDHCRLQPGTRGLLIEVGAGVQVACATYLW